MYLGGGGGIFIVNTNIFNKCPTTILAAHAFYKDPTYIIFMIVVCISAQIKWYNSNLLDYFSGFFEKLIVSFYFKGKILMIFWLKFQVFLFSLSADYLHFICQKCCAFVFFLRNRGRSTMHIKFRLHIERISGNLLSL